MSPMLYLLQKLSLLFWIFTAVAFGHYVGSIARTITYVTLADGRRQARSIPLLFRVLLPLAPNFRRWLLKPAMRATCERADERIVQGGFEGLLAGWEFVALQFLTPLCLVPFWILLMHSACRANPMISKFVGALDMLGLLLFATYPALWLKKAIRKRQKAILRSLPFVLDLLTLSVEAGLDFMSAMQRNVERRKIDELGEELLRVIRETQLGASRRQALRAMAKRVGLPELTSVVNALVQADELGVSIGAILRIQSDQIRQRRFDYAEKMANEAPVKLLGPLLVFIFPTVFLVLLGPVVLRIYRMMFG